MDIEKLRELCSPLSNEKPYYRPFTSDGDVQDKNIFFVGTNLATAIYPTDIDLDSYVNLLLNYDEFIAYYKTNRIVQGKTELSRTRIGMNAFIRWLKCHTGSTIIETDVIPYPTAKLKDLKKEPQEVKDRGKEIFFETLMEFQPWLIILHGKKTVDNFIDILTNKGIIQNQSDKLPQSIEEMEGAGPLFEITYQDGTRGIVMACRHFMYYGSVGNSYEIFRNNILKVINHID
ncbi:MAG: hypothetical protein JJT76_11155 [Clostridiaceae bacterium]|nr:hypothetical protein [Clostridiaceae bacterium]